MFEEQVAALDAALAKGAAATGCRSRQECHAALEEHRQMVEQSHLAPNEASKALLRKQAEKFNRPVLDQVMAAYALRERIAADEPEAMGQAAAMAAAVTGVAEGAAS
jgi:hypothetical protein